jgi:hypothetical protein
VALVCGKPQAERLGRKGEPGTGAGVAGLGRPAARRKVGGDICHLIAIDRRHGGCSARQEESHVKHPGRLSAVLGAAAASVVIAAPAAFAADVTVRPADISAGTPWAVSPNNTGTAGIGALADPIHADGSAHLQVTGGQRAQLKHSFTASLASVAAQPLSYQVYVDPNGSSAASIRYGVNLQLEVGGPIYTTLSFQPQLAGGAAADTWTTFTNSATSLWRTSRAVGALPAGTDHTLADYISAEGNSTVIASYLNIGVLGDPTATLNAYADNVSVDGTTYNFATAQPAEAVVEAPPTVRRGAPAPLSLSFSSPADGPAITDPSALFTITGPASLRSSELTVTADGAALALSRQGTGEYSAPLALPGGTLEPGTSVSVALSLLLGHDAPCGTYVVSGELLSSGNPVASTQHQSLTLPCPVTPPGPGPVKPTLPATGAFAIGGMAWTSIAAIGAGLGLSLLLRRRRTARIAK